MKRIKLGFILMLGGLLSCNFSQAQSGFCANIITEVTAVEPQSGNHNYFGIRVKLDQTYDQDVTVNGFIYHQGDPNTNNPFSVTVTAGNLTAETSANFYETDPTGTADFQIGSTSPSTLTNSGITYSTACVQSKSITVNSSFDIDFSKWGDDADDYSTSGFSTEGTTILDDLKNLMLNYDSTDDVGFFTSLNDLQEQAIGLSDPAEIYAVGIPVTIAIYSINYWKSNGNIWISTFKNQEYNRTAVAADGPCGIKLRKIGGADVGGAIGGGRAGLLGGPGSAAAGAILGSATTSLYNLTNQVLDCYFSWWPF